MIYRPIIKMTVLLISLIFLMGMSRNSPPVPKYKICVKEKVILANPVIKKCVEYKWVNNTKFEGSK